jgi:hypothetical protein
MIKAKEKLLQSINTLEGVVRTYEKEVHSIETNWKDRRKNEFYQKYISVQTNFNKSLCANLQSLNFEFSGILSRLEALK